MQATQGDWLPARAALHPTGLYFALRDIRSAELQDPFMQETVARVAARESVVQIAREDVGKGTAGTSPARSGGRRAVRGPRRARPSRSLSRVRMRHRRCASPGSCP